MDVHLQQVINVVVPCTVSFCRAWNIPSEGLQALERRRILELENQLQAVQWIASPERIYSLKYD